MTDEGSATVLVMAAALAVLGLAAGGIALAEVSLARVRAAGAADMAALAAAAAHGRGQDPCPAAGRMAAAGGAELSACVIDGPDVLVEVAVRTPPVIMHRGLIVTQSARAGPPGLTGGS